MKLLCVYILPLLVALSWAVCPLPAEVKDDEGNKLCARMYADSSVYYEDCCVGDYLDVKPGEDVPYIALRFNNRVSSLVVATRCELTVWSKKPKDGVTKKFSNGSYPRLAEVKKGLLGSWDDSISSYYCKCN
ncbi:PREDICTED: syncollin [Nanorana parkeri]|uniref:syncollin n=1 Tax=Nanorana parkeri TaxID=125878 RepID=UPI00085419E9|nr:PREDICTED: syncollin [Nanorana parkeri]